MRTRLEAAVVAGQDRLEELGPLDRQGGVVRSGGVLVGTHVLEDHRDPARGDQALGAGAGDVAHEPRAGDQPALLRAPLVLGEGIVAGQADQRHAREPGVGGRLDVRPPHDIHVEAVERKGSDAVEAASPVVLDEKRRVAVRDGDRLELAQPVADEPGAADLPAGDGEGDVLPGEALVAAGVDRGELAGKLAERHGRGQRPGALADVGRHFTRADRVVMTTVFPPSQAFLPRLSRNPPNRFTKS